MSLTEFLSRVNISSRNTNTNVPRSDADHGVFTDRAEQTVPSYDAPPPHEEFDTPPSYTLSFSDAYKQWIASSEAGESLLDAEKEYEEVERKLIEMKKELKVLKDRSAEHFARLHERKKRPSISRFIKGQTTKRKRSTDSNGTNTLPSPTTRTLSADNAAGGDGAFLPSDVSQLDAGRDSRQALQFAFEASHAAEMQQTTKVNEVEARAEEIKYRVRCEPSRTETGYLDEIYSLTSLERHDGSPGFQRGRNVAAAKTRC